MQRNHLGYHHAVANEISPGAKYLYQLDGSHKRPDPASRFQPEGVHGPSQLIDLRNFAWTDSNWQGIPLENSVFYELHVGTFTPEGTFSALIPQLDQLADLGITTIELMPIAQFSGTRNWGYDGVYPFAPQNSYGSPHALQQFVNDAHAKGLAVALDVVYNHLGPEGNYLSEYAPYFTEHYKTPWGTAINFDGPHSDEVRRFFIENALYWLEHFHFDALRLDAVHSVYDASAYPFFAELSDSVSALSHRLGRKIHLIAESDLNNVNVLRSSQTGGYGMDGQWSDDFHHSIHTLLTKETSGYYADFGSIHHLAKTLENGWYYSGQYSKYRQRRHGNSPSGLRPSNFVVCNQNHDQVGNRVLGDRLASLVDFEALKLAAGITLLSPFVPMLFMGEEYAEKAAFQYFTSHTDTNLAQAVTRGRAEEFRAFGWTAAVPDPQAESTFTSSKLNHHLATTEPHKTLRRFYQTLLHFRHRHSLGTATSIATTEFDHASALLLTLTSIPCRFAMLFHFRDEQSTLHLQLPPGPWTNVFDSAAVSWRGPGANLPAQTILDGATEIHLQPYSFIVFEQSLSTSE
jgi:maltooligosyltrehalose trehalohydrolase